ncbi:MAG: hypothetical protein CH6_2933 [Candidatus Kapaibacterium sp.]|nr:MAG: hypothetical protein CH6_2933 [Candidatus Kapabacteria bacterium]
MDENRKYKIIQPLKKEVSDDILFKSRLQEELHYRQQLMKEIRERIRLSVETNDPAFWKTLRVLLGMPEEK